MIVVMQPGALVSDIGKVIGKIEQMGLKPHPSHGAEQTIIGIIGDLGVERHPALKEIEQMHGVAEITTVSTSFKLVNREFKAEPTVVTVNGVSIGGKEFVVMAGPCAVESRDQVLTTARAVRAAGARVLRGGAFKPRTSPYSFQGLGEEGLAILLAAKEETGLAVVTEVTSPELVPLVGRYADILQIGARNMQNYALLEAVGDTRKPVLLKRGMMCTIEELLLAAEYVVSRGNAEVMLCERGIRTFEKATRNTLDISAVAVIKEKSHLPVIVDPSHATGHTQYVPAMSRAAIAAGADGIIVEVHPSPKDALADGAQSLRFDQFRALVDELRPIAAAMGRSIATAQEDGAV